VATGREPMNDPKTAPGRRVLLGHIAGAHGVRGDVLIKAHTAAPESIAAYGLLEDETGRKLEVNLERVTAKGVIARIAGVADRTAAEKLKGVKLYVAREQLPETAAGEFYHADLIGLAAVDLAGAPVGRIVAVENFGAGDLLEIRLEGAHRTELLPFTDAFVPEVDLARGRVVVVLPEEDNEQASGEGG